MSPREKPKLTREEARKDHRQMLRFMAFNALIGSVVGAMAAGLIIMSDLGGIGTRVAHGENPIMPVLLIVLPFAFLFGGGAAASAILLMPYETKYGDEDPQDRKTPDV